MRVYQNLAEAQSEMTRDLAKSPEILSTRVQNLTVNAVAHEAMGYSYTVLEFPSSHEALVALAIQLGRCTPEQADAYLAWLHDETHARFDWRPGLLTERLNPDLAAVAFEGNEPSYTYTDRLRGAVEGLTQQLLASPDTRRAFWPIFTPDDAVRAQRRTRIPCSLGYWVALRSVDTTLKLQLTYLQRSCDFKRFWLWDIWFAHQFQREIVKCYNLWTPRSQIELGHTSHIILSLHRFEEAGEEIY